MPLFSRQGFRLRPLSTARMRPVPLAIAMAIASAPAHAATIIVTDGGDAGGDTTCTLRQAIVSANKDSAGDTTCADGSGSDTIEFDASLVGATITLGGTELSIKSPLQIVGSGQTIDAGKASRVMYVGFTTLVASDLALVNGVAPTNNSGGGLFTLQSTIQLDRVSITGNSAEYAAGIAAFNYAQLTLTDVTISGNAATRKGGGIEVVNGTSMTLRRSDVSGNTAARGAAAFVGYHGTLRLDRSTVSGNTATSAPPQSGGGIYGYRCDLVQVVDSTLSGNTSNYRGSAVGATECTLSFVNATVAGNLSTFAGGAIYLAHADATLVNSTVSQNVGYECGGLFGRNATIVARNTIISDNTAAASNETIADMARYDGTSADAQYSLLGTALDIGVFNGSERHNLFSDDPQLGPLQDNGGPTPTMALLGGSPAIDAGSNALAYLDQHALTGDQRGQFARIEQGVVDIGAYEYQPDRIMLSGFEALP